jgi:DNA-binding NarL/FixJ family response regulator
MLLVRKTVHHANAAARDLLARDAAPDLRGWDFRRLEGVDATLAIRRRGEEGVAPRAAAAAVRWRLTSRQREVLELLATGATNVRIAAELEIAEATVEVHVSRILERAQVDNRAALVAALWTMA